MGCDKPVEGILRNGFAAALLKPSGTVSLWCVMRTAALNQDVVDQTTVARLQVSREDLKPALASLEDISFEHGFVWYPRHADDVESDLPSASRKVTKAWVVEAERERRQLRRRRGLYGLLVLVIAVGTLAVSHELAAMGALEYIGIEVAPSVTKALP